MGAAVCGAERARRRLATEPLQGPVRNLAGREAKLAAGVVDEDLVAARRSERNAPGPSGFYPRARRARSRKHPSECTRTPVRVTLAGTRVPLHPAARKRSRCAEALRVSVNDRYRTSSVCAGLRSNVSSRAASRRASTGRCLPAGASMARPGGVGERGRAHLASGSLTGTAKSRIPS